MKSLRLAALFCILSSLLCPLAAQMPGAGGARMPPQLGGSGGTTGTQLFALPGGVALPVNCNQTGDNPIVIASAGNYRINNIFVTSESGSFSAAKIGLYTAPSQGGTALVAQSALSGLTTTAPNVAGSMISLTTPAANMTQHVLYFNVGTAQSSACLVNIYVLIVPFVNG